MKFYLNDHKKIHSLLVLSTVVLLIYAIIAQCKFTPVITNVVGDKDIVHWNIMAIREGDCYVYSHMLPENLDGGDTIVFYTSHKVLSVDIDGKEVYSLKSGGEKMSTGYVWNFIPLADEYSRQVVCVRVERQHGELVPTAEFFVGPEIDIMRQILAESAYMFIVGFLIMIVGSAMMIVWIVSNIKNVISIGNGMSYFSSFAIFLGIWTMAESQIIELVCPLNLFLVFVDHGALMMMPITFILYVKEIFTACKIKYWKGFCYSGVLVIIVRIFLQLTGMMNLRDSLWLTHISIIAMGVLALYMVWCELKSGRLTNELKLNCICIVVLLMAGLIELILFVKNVDNTAFGSTAFLFYVVVNAIGNLLNANAILRRAGENEIYRKMAITDVLTGLGNRLGFQHELNDRTAFKEESSTVCVESTTLFMMDLNDLKVCNDEFGHDYGDWYIMTAAEAIEKTFAGKGKVYRIGGDEFAAITSEIGSEAINRLHKCIISNFEKGISSDKRCPLNIAVGFASYDPQIDRLLSDTLKRADANMYENKIQIKEQNKN